MAEQYLMQGTLKGVEMTNGIKQNGSQWKRASIKIEDADGNTSNVATFNEGEIDKANSFNGKEVELCYTNSSDGKYKNLVDDTLVGKGTTSTLKNFPTEKPSNVQPSVVNNATAVKDNVMTKTDWANKDKRNYRAMAISYSKDLIIAGKIEKNKMQSVSHSIFEFIWDGFDFENPKETKETKEGTTIKEEVVK